MLCVGGPGLQSRTISRKVAEIMFSTVLERVLTKPQIIEAYLNKVYWGHGVVGIAHASAAYFRKKPSQLNGCVGLWLLTN